MSACRCFVVLGWLGYFSVHSALASLAAKGWRSANAAIKGWRLERQQHFALPTFILARRKNWADESGRPLTEKRYSPYRP